MSRDTGNPARALAEALACPQALGHPLEHCEILETHISVVLLTGRFAYKIKKPVDLGFVDFSTRERRRWFCEEELRLNRRLAPELYLAVVPITGTPQAPRLGAAGEPFEHALKMREFPQEARLDRVLARGALAPERLERFAASLAEFHAALPPGEGRWGTPAAVAAQVRAAFDGIEPLPGGTGGIDLWHLRAWVESELERCATALARRVERVRECHGDLHLTNLVLLDERIVAFDCIEFDPGLRWTDVAAEVAFLAMDLEVHARPDLAARFVNAWLEVSGDYDALSVLRLYLVYRSLVRAKVAAIRARQTLADGGIDDAAQRRAAVHLQFAAGVAVRPRRPWLAITCGVSGSGKSRIARELVGLTGAIQLRSDVERKRLAGLRAAAASGGGIYTAEMTGRTYERLAALARAALAEGWPVVVDATFLERARRSAFRELAAALGVPFRILALEAAPAILERRVRERTGDASEADVRVLHRQLARREPLADAERDAALTVDTGAGSADVPAIAARLAQWAEH